ncbi:MAG: hypothetical protein ACK4SL_04300 [Candidatus Paceibacteria bacterium]
MLGYVINKIASLLIPIVAIAVVVALVPVPQSWTLLLVLVSLLGYTHYFIGAYYQHQAWRRRGMYRRFLYRFTLLSVVSVGLVVLAILNDLLWLVAILTIPYFVWHGYENEHTLFTRATGQQLSVWLLGGISAVAVGATIDAFRHTSANFSYSLIYTAGLIPKFTGTLAELDSYLYFVGFGLMLVGSMAIWFATFKRYSRANVFWSVASATALIWFFIDNPLPYIWLFVLLLGYHFLTWGIHYGVVFWPQTKKFFNYLMVHGLVVVGVVVVSMGIGLITSQFPLGLLNSEFFLTATLVHISTSFLNDNWLQKALGL